MELKGKLTMKREEAGRLLKELGEELLSRMRGSSLLLTTCCNCLNFRFSDNPLGNRQ